MKSNHPSVLRAMYIILVPVVLLIILLNTGTLQRFLTAATVHGERYTVVRYNYYYFDFYNSFLEENEDRLAELGYDPEQPESKQSYDGTMTWKEFFQRQAEAELARTAYYCDLAQAAGYEFSEAELAPVEETLAEHYQEQLHNNISTSNYYLSYYGAGMDETRYRAELTRQIQAHAYEEYLTRTYEPGQAELDQWLEEHPGTDYRAARLRVITLEALPDRATGEVGEAQLAALTAKLDKLAARYDAGVPFEAIQRVFSSRALGDETGALVATAENLPDTLAGWCLGDQKGLNAGETLACVDEETGMAYFVLLDGLGDSGRVLEAKADLGAAATEETRRQILSDYPVERSAFGMLLATT